LGLGNRIFSFFGNEPVCGEYAPVRKFGKNFITEIITVSVATHDELFTPCLTQVVTHHAANTATA
jgi:hypothetical protein